MKKRIKNKYYVASWFNNKSNIYTARKHLPPLKQNLKKRLNKQYIFFLILHRKKFDEDVVDQVNSKCNDIARDLSS